MRLRVPVAVTGTFDCARYVVTGGDGTIKTMWFATKLPGPPVKMTARRGADTVMTMTMLSSGPRPM